MEAGAGELNPGHFKGCETARRWVRCKLAMSLDGRTAMASGESQWITGKAARRDVQHWRARSCVVLTGIGTVLADNPQLGLRPSEFDMPEHEATRQPQRVVLDSARRLPPDSRLLDGAPVIVFTAQNGDGDELRAAGATLVQVPSTSQGLDLGAVLDELGRREINEVLVEAGATLSGALLRQGLVDELLLYVAPMLMGSLARPLFALPLNSMAEAISLELVDQRRFGADMRLIYRPRPVPAHGEEN